MIQAKFTEDSIYSTSQEAFSLFEKSSFGEKTQNRIKYSLSEALYLLQSKKIEIFSGKKPLTLEQFLKKAKKLDKKIELKHLVFSDLRKKGYILKTALKFGAEFRVYDKGIRPGKDHAKWILFIVKESETLKWHEFAAKNRVAHSTRKALLLAIVDDESSISYYEINWKRP